MRFRTGWKMKSGSCVEKDVPIADDMGNEILVDVHYFVQPAEPDVNMPAGVEIEQVFLADEDILSNMSDEDLERVTQWVIGRLDDN